MGFAAPKPGVSYELKSTSYLLSSAVGVLLSCYGRRRRSCRQSCSVSLAGVVTYLVDPVWVGSWVVVVRVARAGAVDGTTPLTKIRLPGLTLAIVGVEHGSATVHEGTEPC